MINKPLLCSRSVLRMAEIQGCYVLYWHSLIHPRSREGKWNCWRHHISAQSVISISWFQILTCVYFSIFFIILFCSSVCKKRWSKPTGPASLKTPVTARRRCSLNLHWCQAGRQGKINILENVVRIPKAVDRSLPRRMLGWQYSKSDTRRSNL